MASPQDCSPEVEMHVVVFGAGALGSLFGVAAHLGGADVTLVGRRPLVRSVADGIVLRQPSGVRRVRGDRLRAVATVVEAGGAIDYMLVTVKTRDLAMALTEGAAVRDRVGCALSLMNGVGHEARLATVFGRERVIGAMTMEGAEMPAPGVVEHTLASVTYLGELSGSGTSRVERLANVLVGGGLHVEIVEDVTVATWTKFVQSCAASGLCGVSRLGYAPATATDAGARLYVQLVKEGVAVARAHGVEPGRFFTDEAAIADIADLPADDAVELVRAKARALIARGYVGSTSLARDVLAGRPTEVDALMGAMCGAADELGVAVPVMRAAYLAIRTVDESLEGTHQ